MAEFPQPPASRAALHEAAVKYLRSSSVVSALAGTSDKKSKAYRNAARRVQLLTAPEGRKQRRKATPGKLDGVGKPKTIHFAGHIVVGGDPKYGVFREPRGGVALTDQEASRMLSHALGDEEDQDEAWQDFFDAYIMPAGFIENPIVSFK